MNIGKRAKNGRESKGKSKAVPFKTLYKGHVRRLKTAYNILNPAGVLQEDEAAWAQCFFGIESFLGKITDSPHDVESMNRHVEKMVQEALRFGGVETIMATDIKEDIFGDKFMKELEGVKLPFTKFQLLVKLLKKSIRDYSKTNKVKAQQFMEMLEKVVEKYNTRDNLTFTNDVTNDVLNGVSDAVRKKIDSLTDELIGILKNLKEDKEEFKKLGISFEEKTFYDILVDVRDKHGFEYADDRCVELAKKIKELIDGSSVFADWINNRNIRNQLKNDLIKLLYKNGYPPQWSNDIFSKILDQVENYKKNN